MAESSPDQDVSVPSSEPQEEPYPSSRYAWYVVTILMLIYVNSFLDRSVLSLLVGPIRSSLGISESQMGFIMGPAFAVFYIIAGIPLGRLADTMSRRWIVFVGQFFWSIMSVGCGLVTNFAQFLSLRVGLGVGEATLSPSAYSMITDLFPKNKLARALSFYGLGIPIGAGLARVIGGIVVGFAETRESWVVPLIGREVFPWQIVFFCVAVPTIPLSIILLTMKEPARRGVKKIRTAEGKLVDQAVPLREVMAYIWENRATMLCHSLGFALLSFSGYGVGAWLPAHLIRNTAMERADVGLATGIIGITCGVPGLLFGGWLSDKLRARGMLNSRTMVGLIACTAWLPFGILYPLMPTWQLTLACYFPAVFIGAMPWGVGPAAIQEIMPNKMRGQASAVYLFIINLFGLGFGPFILSIFTQYVFKADTGVRWSLLVVPLGAHTISAIFLILALKPFLRSLERLKEWNAEQDLS